MNDIVFTENDKVFLNSFLTEESFAKTKLSNLMDCEGLLVSKKNSEFFFLSNMEIYSYRI